jgi:hypothetical protein
MPSGDPSQPAMTADDPLEAEAIRQALSAAGIDARVLADDTVPGRLEIVVPPGTDRQARRIIEQGHWPRLA